ncbi:hypothetical protein [Burkholderia sp. 22313]|uniref:hypothetical protein n=1 Tax=Burkholderia sp. 22313 TaxID=3453908 RepID=UPI003F867B16
MALALSAAPRASSHRDGQPNRPNGRTGTTVSASSACTDACGLSRIIDSIRAACVRHRTIVGQAGIGKLNRLIKLEGSRLKISPDTREWTDEVPPLAGIGAFS